MQSCIVSHVVRLVALRRAPHSLLPKLALLLFCLTSTAFLQAETISGR